MVHLEFEFGCSSDVLLLNLRYVRKLFTWFERALTRRDPVYEEPRRLHAASEHTLVRISHDHLNVIGKIRTLSFP